MSKSPFRSGASICHDLYPCLFLTLIYFVKDEGHIQLLSKNV